MDKTSNLTFAFIQFKGRVTLDLFFGDQIDGSDKTDFVPGEIHEVVLKDNGNPKFRDVSFEDLRAVAYDVPVKLFEVVAEKPE